MKIKSKKSPQEKRPSPHFNNPHWNPLRDGVTYSLLSSFLMCPEKTRIGQVLGLTEDYESGAAGFGNLLHGCLQEVYNHRIKEKTIPISPLVKEKEKDMREALLSRGRDVTPRLIDLEENCAFVEAILPPYFDYWKEDIKGRKWISLETEFSIPLKVVVDGVTYTVKVRGKRDGEYLSSKGKVWVLETKSKGKINEDILQEWVPLDLQSNLYCWSIWKERKECPGGVLYNVVRRPQLQQKKGRETKKGRVGAETLSEFVRRVEEDIKKRPEFYFYRFQSPIAESDMELFETQLKHQISQLIRWFLGQYHWRNSSACSHGGFACKFLPLCSKGDTSKFIKKEKVFPELAK